MQSLFTIPIHELREENPCHTPAGSPAGGQFCSTGVPVAPGTTPVPKGMIRAYHYTNAGEEALASILQHGLSTAHARGSTYGEPNVIWFSTTKPGDFKHYVEVLLTPEELRGGVGGPTMSVQRPEGWKAAETPEERQEVLDRFNEEGSNFAVGVATIPPERIVTHSAPWMAIYHQVVTPSNPALKPIYDEKIRKIVAGELDAMVKADPEKYGKVFAAIKAKFGRRRS